MIIQACINGARERDYHPRLPLDIAAMAEASASCIAAGAAELHVHPRDGSGRESLAAVDATIAALRKSCPGSFIGVSTGAWIEGDEQRTLAAIATWKECPDYASVNLSEPDASAVMQALHRKSIGIEAGLASIADTERFLTLKEFGGVWRILIEVEQQDVQEALETANNIASLLARAGCHRPILAHGFNGTVWPLIELDCQRRWSTRVGLEDTRYLRNGEVAKDNAALIAEAKCVYRSNAI